MNWRILALVVLFLVLRGALMLHGAELGHAETLDVDGARVAALVFRDEKPSDTLLVVSHGAFACKESLLSLCWAARANGVDCVAIDALGHGGSGDIPAKDAVANMSAALRADHALTGYSRVRYIGHSMGGGLGVGRAFTCDQSIAIGNGSSCAENRSVYGNVAPVYFISHVLEPWTPSVLAEALRRTLGINAHDLGINIALAWSVLIVAIALALLLARRVRHTSWPARGAIAVLVFWLVTSLGAARTLWFLIPTQWSDAVLVAFPTIIVMGLVWLLRIKRLWAASIISGLIVFSLSLVLAANVPAMPRLGALLPPLALVTVPATLCAERFTRGPHATVSEVAGFTSILGSLFCALLFPQAALA